MRKYLTALGSVIALSLGMLFLIGGGVQHLAQSPARFLGYAQTAAVWFSPGASSKELRLAYATASKKDLDEQPAVPFASLRKVRILIMPGHEPFFGGTEFKGIYERDVVADIATALKEILESDPRYEVMVARDKQAWHPTLATFFTERQEDILTFRETHRAKMEEHISNGTVTRHEHQLTRTDAPLHVLIPIYGLNLFANENDIHIALHLHLNDYAGRVGEGEHTGFSIYVPERQYSTAETSAAVARAIAGRLSPFHAMSTLPFESGGIVEDQELGALGAYNTIDHASVLIEYGYIYEPQFMDARVRAVAVADYAYQTYLGLQDFFDDPVTPTYGSVAFPYAWESISQRGADVYALQAALRYLGAYPPPGRSFSECSLSGIFGPCTKEAVALYQEKKGITTEESFGTKTAEALHNDLTAPLSPRRR